MAARKRRKKFPVSTKQKNTPLITRETAFKQQVSELVFGVNILDVDLGVQIDYLKTTNLTLETSLIMGLLPSTKILITASLSSKSVQLGFALRMMGVCGT